MGDCTLAVLTLTDDQQLLTISIAAYLAAKLIYPLKSSQLQFLDQKSLVQQSIGGSRPGQPSCNRCVGYHRHEDIQVIFEERKVGRILMGNI